MSVYLSIFFNHERASSRISIGWLGSVFGLVSALHRRYDVLDVQVMDMEKAALRTQRHFERFDEIPCNEDSSHSFEEIAEMLME